MTTRADLLCVLVNAGQALGTLLRFTADDYAAAAGLADLAPWNRASLELLAELRRRLDGLGTPAESEV